MIFFFFTLCAVCAYCANIMKKKRNISWGSEVDELAESLARERGLDVSAFLARLVTEENVDARVVPQTLNFSPGIQKILDARRKK